MFNAVRLRLMGMLARPPNETIFLKSQTGLEVIAISSGRVVSRVRFAKLYLVLYFRKKKDIYIYTSTSTNPNMRGTFPRKTVEKPLSSTHFLR